MVGPLDIFVRLLLVLLKNPTSKFQSWPLCIATPILRMFLQASCLDSEHLKWISSRQNMGQITPVGRCEDLLATERHDKPILEIRKEIKEEVFPGFTRFCCDIDRSKRFRWRGKRF